MKTGITRNRITLVIDSVWEAFCYVRFSIDSIQGMAVSWTHKTIFGWAPHVWDCDSLNRDHQFIADSVGGP